MTVLEIKPLTTAQLNAAVDLDQVCFGGLWTRSGYERELNSPNSQLLVLEAKNSLNQQPFGCNSAVVMPQNPLAEGLPNALVGLGCYWSILEEAHITILAVHPNYQNQGLGQFLLYALLKDAKQRQLEWATLEVKPSNHAALSLYQKFDFIPAGRRRGYYQDTGEDALILWRKGLQQPEFEQTLQKRYEQIVSRLTRQGWQLFSYL
ncbi:ribosomal protein S18-alanine N-acetyltransferase [Coleofasciculus sp. F4-SAH-05]|uniref:ribosomal protein S18-alanine N-acetyltransferase n=1 Tax=Coleofasciculus sp. F4-SAH-05 TaxID=3069525 RepID=UPI0032FF757E